MAEYPEFVTKKFKEISRRTEIDEKKIRQEYEELYNHPFIQEDPQFTTNEKKHRYAIAVLWTLYMPRPPAVVR